MNNIKKLLNLKFLSTIFVLYIIYLAGSIYFSTEELDTYKAFYFSGLAYFTGVIFAPIAEEFIFRYWAYGKNIKLQFSFLITFILYIILDLYQNFIFDIFQFTNNIFIDNFIKNILILLFSLLLYTFIKYFNFKIPSFFSKLTESKFTFLSILLIFEGVHWYNVQFDYSNLHNYILGFVASYLITRNARDLGIYFAILIHIINNALAHLSNLLEIRTEAKNFVSDQLLINYALVSIFFTTIYLVQLLRAKPRILIQDNS